MWRRSQSHCRTSKKYLAPSVAALVAATLFVPVSGNAQEGETPSVSLFPAVQRPNDPDNGNSFFMELGPGQTAAGQAKIFNPSEVAQTVKLYIRDLEYTDQGTPSINDGEQTDVGSWGTFDQTEMTLQPKKSVIAQFSITVPAGADPGDHIGVAIAESSPSGSEIKIVKRVATRVYVTVPGDAFRSFEIQKVTVQLDSLLFPSTVLTSVQLRNTGRVRLRPKVTIKGAAMEGSEILLSRTSERYAASLKVPWYGGLIRMPVRAQAEGGLTRLVNRSKLVIPWGLVVILAMAAGGVWALKRYWWDRRVSRFASLQADMKRIESLVAKRPSSEAAAPGLETDERQEQIDGILAALKRAERTGSQTSLERLALAFHEVSGEALEVLVQALEKSSGPMRQELINAAASYGPAALAAMKSIESLPTEISTELLVRAAGGKDREEAPSKAVVKTPQPKPRASKPKQTAGKPKRALRRKPSSQHGRKIQIDPRSPK